MATTVEQALAITHAMLHQKDRHHRETGRDDRLASAADRDFYLSATQRLHGRGLIHVSALMLDDRVLATHWGALWKGRLVWLMPSYEGGEWAAYSPGRLLLEDLLEWSFERGLREFDFTIGDEPYKAAFQAQSDVLHRLIRARSSRGWAYYDPNPTLDSLRALPPPFAIAPFPTFGAPCSANPFGTALSCDGLHPSASTHRLVASKLREAINTTYGTTIPAIP